MTIITHLFQFFPFAMQENDFFWPTVYFLRDVELKVDVKMNIFNTNAPFSVGLYVSFLILVSSDLITARLAMFWHRLETENY